MCESSGCFDAYEALGGVIIYSEDPEGRDEMLNSLEAWIKFRDDIKAGKYDHIGE